MFSSDYTKGVPMGSDTTSKDAKGKKFLHS